MKPRYVLIGVLLSAAALAQEPTYIDKGACPGEGCRYGEQWVAAKTIHVFQVPQQAATTVATIEEGETVRTLTGEVHTVPGRFLVRRHQDGFAPGDEVLVYTYLGEGRFRVRHNGALKVVDLNFGPWGSSNGTRCEKNEKRCWGTLQEDLRFDWWVRVRTASGLEGWVRGDSDFKKPSYH